MSGLLFALTTFAVCIRITYNYNYRNIRYDYKAQLLLFVYNPILLYAMRTFIINVYFIHPL